MTDVFRGSAQWRSLSWSGDLHPDNSQRAEKRPPSPSGLLNLGNKVQMAKPGRTDWRPASLHTSLLPSLPLWPYLQPHLTSREALTAVLISTFPLLPNASSCPTMPNAKHHWPGQMDWRPAPSCHVCIPPPCPRLHRDQEAFLKQPAMSGLPQSPLTINFKASEDSWEASAIIHARSVDTWQQGPSRPP